MLHATVGSDDLKATLGFQIPLVREVRPFVAVDHLGVVILVRDRLQRGRSKRV